MKIKALLYCTKAKPYLYKTEDTTYPAYPIGYHTDKNLKVKLSNTNELANLNGKIVAECDYEVEEIENVTIININASHLQLLTNKLTEEELFKHSCLSRYEMFNYLKKGFSKADEPRGYAIHIKNLHIFDKPRELNHYMVYDKFYDNTFGWDFEEEEKYNPLTKAPQNMMRVWLYENGEWVMYILISIQSQWMCKILNGEKTIEVRKKVLKGMFKNE